MSQHIMLEALYPEMEEATIGRWLVAGGDRVAEGQPMAELITDKVAYEFQSPVAGIVLTLLITEKSIVPVGTVLAVIGETGDTIADLDALLAANRELAATREASLTALQEATSAVTPSATPALGRTMRATPAARRLARERGIDLATLQGSGPDGMVTVEDIPPA